MGRPLPKPSKALGPWIKHVHVKDSANFSEEGFDLTLVGEGSLPIGEAVELLRSSGYQDIFHWNGKRLGTQKSRMPRLLFPTMLM